MRPMTSRSSVLPLIATSIVVAFTAQQMRLFASGLTFGLADARGVSPWLVGLIGVAVSALALLSVMLVRSFNRSIVMALISVVCLARIGSQIVEEPLALLAVAAVGVVIAGIMFPAIALVHGGRVAGAGLVLGGALDIAIMAFRHTMDLTRSSSLAAMAVVVAMSIIALGALAGEREVTGLVRLGPAMPAAAAFAVGPWLAIHLTVTGNLGFIGAITGLSLSVAAAVAAGGTAVALAWAAPGRTAPHPAVAAIVAAGTLMMLGTADGSFAAFLIVVSSVATGGVVTGAFDRETTAPRERVAWAGGAGMVVGFLALAVVYLPLMGIDLSATWLFGLMALPLLGTGLACLPTRALGGAPWPAPAVLATLMLAVPLVLYLQRPPTENLALVGDPFVMTYNLHHGYAADGGLALESMARVIESQDPDVVALQELSRGWIATGGVDMVYWLEERLGMQVIFAPTIDRQSGVGLATGLATSNPLVTPLGSGNDGPSRAALDVLVDVSTGEDLRVLVTQLHQIRPDVAIRQQQVNDLIAAWGGVARTLVVGDLGTAPDDEVTAQLVQAGLVDAADLVVGSAATWPAADPHSQHDYILGTGDLAVSVARVIPLVASDHLAVQVRVGSVGVSRQSDDQ